jgi:hypothetical protein
MYLTTVVHFIFETNLSLPCGVFDGTEALIKLLLVSYSDPCVWREDSLWQ